ncbi:cadmium-translocating P-type ATPase [Sporosarcina sp. ANT_H38]|uniref:heavy metal translocating P-type ATPase n=1 Tax=Sporosarcina sp. ANT_H38 TaxID=2597358 RepID=UPI0011F17578|nr:heavy metal translocating P-type ATPase [Sporosarcina sp. ANT_H38]KAA0948448.1 cadmium-translocating P-type ATPase [Sporosarcina sp. ANT_H38]
MATVEKKEYRLENLTCASCAMKFEKNVKNLPSVQDAQVNFGASKLVFSGSASVEDLETAGAFDGIKVAPLQNKRIEPKIPFFKRKENLITLFSLLFLMMGMIISFRYTETHPAAIVLFAIAIVIGGTGIFKVGLRNLIRFEFDMKTLMTIAIIGAAIIGEWREGAVVVFLFAVSEALEAYSMNKARQSIRKLMDIAPPAALVKRGEEFVELPTEDIVVGDILIVKPGQKIAMDGSVLTGTSTVNQAAITGESIPVLKMSGDNVFAGTLNEEGALEVTVTKLVGDTTIAKIIHLVEDAQAEKAPSQKFVDKFAKYYTPAIIVIAILVAIIPPLLGGDWNAWIYQGLAVLVVGCPCALVVSTPVAIVTAIGNAARQGVLIKGGIHLEETGRLDVIAFDKTGTLTKGYPEVTDFIVTEIDGQEKLLSAIAAVESMSQHPLAKAVVNYAHKNGAQKVDASNFQSITGKGAYAEIEGVITYIGSLSWAQELSSLPEQMLQQAVTLQQQGKSVMAIVTGTTFSGLLAVADPIREESRDVLRQLKNIGIRHTVMLTGDHQVTAEAIAAELGVTDVRAGLMPEDKLTAIKQLSDQYGRVAMVGDGINDAPALAAASVGIAMGGAGTDAALETADIALMADDLGKLPYTMKLSRKTLRIIKENIMFALGLKIIALLLIIPGWLTLWIAIFADMGATLLVVLNSLRLLRVHK